MELAMNTLFAVLLYIKKVIYVIWNDNRRQSIYANYTNYTRMQNLKFTQL